MLEVTRLYSRTFDLDHISLYWEIASIAAPRSDADQHDIYNYEFFILRAGDSPMGPYDQIAGPFVDQYSFRDVQVTLLHKWRQYFYKLKVVDRRTGEAQEFGPTSSGESPPDLIASAVMYEEDMYFREYAGRRCWLFNAKTFGPRCSCFDITVGRLMRSGHLPCFGTGFLGGYMSPIEVWPQIDPNPKSSEASSLQEKQQNDTAARMISFPPVNPNDILVESDNRRWRVIKVTPTQRLRAVVRQELQLHEIPRGDIEYSLPVKVDEKDVQAAAARNYTNPQNLDDGDDFSKILRAYGHPSGTLR